MRHLLCQAALALGLLTAGTMAAQAGDLRVTVAGVKDGTGRIMIALHVPSGADFPDDVGVVAAQWSGAAASQVSFVFTDLAPGRYAIAAFHDADSDGVLNTNAIGIPTEGYGFSRDASGTFGPPSFDAAALEIGGTDLEATLTLAY